MYAAIRVRGTVNIPPKIKRAFKQLNLNKPNHLVLLKENKISEGQLKLLSPYITYGVINKSTLAKLLKKRARLVGDKKLNEEWLKKKNFNSFLDLADAIIQNKITLQKLGIRKSYKEGGALGFRGDDINQLILRMM